MVVLPLLLVCLWLSGWGALGQNSTTYIIQYQGLTADELQEKCNILNCLQIYTNVIQGILVQRDPAAASALSADDPYTVSVTRNVQVSLRTAAAVPGPDVNASNYYYYGGPPFRQLNAPWWLDRIDQVSLPLDGIYTPINNCSNVTAYVLDTGINANHSEFRFVGNALQTRVGRGYLVPDRNSRTKNIGTDDCNGHVSIFLVFAFFSQSLIKN